MYFLRSMNEKCILKLKTLNDIFIKEDFSSQSSKLIDIPLQKIYISALPNNFNAGQESAKKKSLQLTTTINNSGWLLADVLQKRIFT